MTHPSYIQFIYAAPSLLAEMDEQTSKVKTLLDKHTSSKLGGKGVITLQIISNWVHKISIWIIIVLFAVMVCSILLEVFAHNFLDFSFIWSGELAQYCFVWITFIGASAVYKQNEMIAFDTLLDKLPKKLQRVVFILIQIVIIIFPIVFTYYGFKKAFSSSVMIQMSTGFHVPMLVPYISIPIGMIMLLIHVIANLLDRRANGGRKS